jgi:hypothetical protein
VGAEKTETRRNNLKIQPIDNQCFFFKALKKETKRNNVYGNA